MIYGLLTKIYCHAHRLVKRMLGRVNKPKDFYDIPKDHPKIEEYFPVENLLLGDISQLNLSFVANSSKLYTYYGESKVDVIHHWESFIKNSIIPNGYKYAGLHYAGYVWEFQKWCLPSWLWTNAAIVKCYCLQEKKEEAIQLGELLLKNQHPSGGWIVRYDYTKDQILLQLAPNDSAYIANNALLAIYKKWGGEKYLIAAKRCAEWIIDNSRPDGMVYIAYDVSKGKWNKENNIVDTGFTAALFVNLYSLTQEKEYLDFTHRFVNKYISLFYNDNKKYFWTSLINDKPRGGAFTRGQAWALEGLIPFYQLTKSPQIQIIINDIVSTLIKKQHKSGGWSYNLEKFFSGEDCKGIPIIAYWLIVWGRMNNNSQAIKSAQKALEWTKRHTCINGNGEGGIFAFNLEGAIVHSSNTATAFVYSSAYSIEATIEMSK